MKSSNNSCVVASFKDINEEVIKTIFINKEATFNVGMVPDNAIAYYIYSKKDNGKFSCDASCRIGQPLKNVIDENKVNIRLLAFFEISQKECVYLVKNGKEYVASIDDNTSLANDFEEFVMSFENDLQKINTNNKKLVKKM